MAKKYASYDELAAAVKAGRIAPIYLLYGEERWFADRLQALIVDRVLRPEERDFNLDLVHGHDAEAQAVVSLCSSYPMMAERRVVVVRAVDALDDPKLLTTYARQPNPSAVCIFVASGSVNPSHHPWRAMKEHGVVAEFGHPGDRDLPRWIKGMVEERRFEIDGRALAMLAETVGNDLHIVEREVEKITAFVGDRVRISRDDVVLASGQTREFNVFELQDAVGGRRFQDAMRIAERLLQQASNGTGEAIMIVSVLSSYFQKLWVLSGLQHRSIPEKEAAKAAGVPPFFLGDYLTSLRRFDSSSLTAAFSALIAADFELKGGSHRDPRLVLGLLLRRLTGGVEHPAHAA